jgi:hypothetical protein
MSKDALGDRGESIVFVNLTAFHGGKPLFRPAPLGAKWPIADFAVELVGYPGTFFLLQAKATQAGMNVRKRLKVSVTRAAFNSLVTSPIPRYVVGVDEPTETAYISAALAPRTSKLSSVSTAHSLRDAGVRQTLFDEVLEFWAAARQAAPWSATKLTDK